MEQLQKQIELIQKRKEEIAEGLQQAELYYFWKQKQYAEIKKQLEELTNSKG